MWVSAKKATRRQCRWWRVIAGIGYVANTRSIVMVDDYLTKGGSITELGSKKRLRLYHIALQQKLPVIALSQSGGGDLTSLGDWFGFSAAGFAMQARLSAAGIPQITVVHGSATAGGAYQPGLSDYVIMIRNQSGVPCRSAFIKSRNRRNSH